MNVEPQRQRLKLVCRRLVVAVLVLEALILAGVWSKRRDALHLTYRIVDPNTGKLVSNASATVLRSKRPGFPISALIRLCPPLRPIIKSVETTAVVGSEGTIDLTLSSRGEYTLVFGARGYYSTEFTFCKEHDICRFRSYDPGLPTTFLIWSTNLFTLPLRRQFVPQSANGSPFYIHRPELF